MKRLKRRYIFVPSNKGYGDMIESPRNRGIGLFHFDGGNVQSQRALIDPRIYRDNTGWGLFRSTERHVAVKCCEVFQFA